MGVGLVCTSNHCCIHLRWVSFSSGYLSKQGQLPFFYLFWTTNLKYTVLQFADWLEECKLQSQQFYSVFQVACPEEIKNGSLPCLCKQPLLYSSQVGFIQQWLLVQTRPTPISYLFCTSNLKYTVLLSYHNDSSLNGTVYLHFAACSLHSSNQPANCNS